MKKMVQTCCMPPTDASLFASSSHSSFLLSYLPTEISPPVSFRNNSEFSEKNEPPPRFSLPSPVIVPPPFFFFHRHIFLRYLALKKRKEPRLPFTSSSSFSGGGGGGGEGKFFTLLSALLHFSFFSSPLLLLFLLRNLLVFYFPALILDLRALVRELTSVSFRFCSIAIPGIPRSAWKNSANGLTIILASINCKNLFHFSRFKINIKRGQISFTARLRPIFFENIPRYSSVTKSRKKFKEKDRSLAIEDE